MIVITEAQSAAVVSHALAFDAVRDALIAASSSNAAVFPVVHGHGTEPTNRFTIKSSAGGGRAGLKIGSYFPTNDAVGLPRHSSTTLLFDQSTGRIAAVVEGAKLNAYRTAAANAVATHALARPDAKVLAVFGTGHQARYEIEAMARVRQIERVLVVGRSPGRAESFVDGLQKSGIPAEISDARTACRAADMIVTVTNATEPLFDADWVQQGTHISSMGSDAPGKQELPVELLLRAELFCDLADQSRRIGEFQHVPQAPLTEIGKVLTGTARGRTAGCAITVFDSSGISLQDLFVASAVLEQMATDSQQ